MKTDKRCRKILLILTAALIGFFALGMCIGASESSLAELLRSRVILLKVRLPRCLACVFAGAALSCSGLLLQAALNNSLAAPGIIGVNSGSALFVVASAILFPGNLFAKDAGAFIGALAAVCFVCAAGGSGRSSKHRLILAGVAISSLFVAFSDTLINLFPASVGDKSAFSVGSFSSVSGASAAACIAMTVPALSAALLISRKTDVLVLGDDVAASLGLNVRKTRSAVLFLAAFLAASAVTVCGLLNFMGLIVPHIIKKILKGADHAKLVIACAVGGADFCLGCDVLARWIFAPYELPVGIILSALGVPFFLYLIRERTAEQ